MTFDIGSTEYWIDPLDNWLKWFTLPSALEESLVDAPQLPKLITDLALTRPISRIRQMSIWLAMDCDMFNNPYHNTDHALRVMNNVQAGLDAIAKHTSVQLPQTLREVIALACVCHDHGHPGKTFLMDTPVERRPSDKYFFPQTTALEQISADTCVRELIKLKATSAQQLLATYLIWSTTFGAAAPQGKALGLDKVQPTRPLGLLIRAADITLLCDDVACIEADAAVQYGEGGFNGDIKDYLANRRGFLKYVSSCYQALDRSLGFSLTEMLGWQDRLDDNLTLLKRVARHDLAATIIVRTQIARYYRRRGMAAEAYEQQS